MRLTPADVHNVAFKKPSIGKRGYDEDEVDAFLDLVEAELSRLIEENNGLDQQLAARPAIDLSAPEPTPQIAQPDVAQLPAAGDQGSQDLGTPPPTELQTAAVAAPPEPDQAGPAAHHVQAAKLLGLAQETAERLTGDAAREAEETRAAAIAESRETVSKAQAEADRLVTEATDLSETTVSEANARAEAAVRDATVRAEALDREAQEKYTQVISQLAEQRTSLEKKIDDLRIYEREYRSRLKTWISDQLSTLEDQAADQPASPRPI